MGSPAQMGARPWDGRAPASAGLGHGRPTWPSSPVGGLGGRPRVVASLLSALPLVFGAFLEAPKSYRRDSQTVAKLSSIRTQRSLFRRIQRSFDPPNTSKRRRMSKKRAVGDPTGGPLALLGLGHGMAEPQCLRGSAMADPHGRSEERRVGKEGGAWVAPC